MLQIKKIIVGMLQTNCYLVTNEKQETIIIDPGSEPEKIKENIQDKKVVGILVTHYHFDHIGALKELEEYYHVKANQEISEFTYEIIKTPGHTLDSLSYYFKDEKIVFVGDFIFKNTIGRMNLGGDAKKMQESIQKILTELPLENKNLSGTWKNYNIKRRKRTT